MGIDKEIGQGFEDEVVAKYVIQINLSFRPKSMHHLGAFNVWKKSGWFGRADELMSFCPENGCIGVIPEKLPITEAEYTLIHENPNNPKLWPKKVIRQMSHYYQTSTVCPVCKSVAIRETLPDSYGFNMSSLKISERAEQLFNNLGQDADFLLVRSKEDAAFQKARQYLFSTDRTASEYVRKLENARDQDTVFYPLKKLISDTSAGGSVARRVRALVEA